MMSTKMKRATEKPISLKKALEGYHGEVRFNEPIAPYTSLKIGGPAEVMVFPKSVLEVAALMEKISKHRLPFFILGGGTNVLVRDGGIAGIVLHLKHLNRIVMKDAEEVVPEAGVSYPKLSTYVMGKGLSGLEFAVGIPGTVGGAVAMNAGIPGEETASVLKEFTFVGQDGGISTLRKGSVRFGYRGAALPPGVVVSASFRLTQAPVERIEEKLKRLLKRRRETQPLSFPNVGSIFKNPTGGFAGKLIEEVGLKGHRIGDAQISERHGNFIINRGSATAREVLALIRLIGQRVEQERGITLEWEVKIVGRDRA